ncbi:hypothetical protein AXG93_1877s1060 [Marchantia polymorpha subsp. ruderalis]|uniref:Coiled-coil domain-containing protein 22 homolog n=1 Tax=Marchantia polymorpha subsp. ruderalis TaxID=1480154 RepID=A0A176VT43_MARPO|nr:hypothetical protein AXG93_1877s1060 [Marchantia polymorpha subsp. ruderalis]
MDDAQGIVLLALQRAGVELPDDVHSVGDLRPKQLMPIYGHALSLLRGSPLPELPAEFPQQRAERFRFLYPSEADTHRLLRFLLDKLSQTSSAAGRGRGARKGRAAGRIGVDDFGGSKISATVRHALSVCWDEANSSGSVGDGKDDAQMPGFRVGGESFSGPIDSVEKVIEWGIPFRACPIRLASQRVKKQPPLITLQAKPRTYLVPSILELNSRSAEKSARLADAQLAHLARHADKSLTPSATTDKKVITHGVLLVSKEAATDDRRLEGKLARDSSSSLDDELRLPEAAEARERTEISRLENQLSALTLQAEKAKEEVDAVEEKASELKKKIETSSAEAIVLEERRLLLETAVNLALDESRSPEDVLQELELVVKEGDERLLALQAEWDAVRSRLEERVADADKTYEARNSEIQSKLQKMREMRQEVKDMTAKMWAREAEETQFLGEVEKLAKGASRATYVRRITELVRNSKKQDADIARIIQDTRELQRESNMSQDKLRRLHALVDETVFRDAKKDPVCRQAYKLLSGLHINFENIIEKVLEMDKVGREISELQAKLEELEKRPLDAASVEADLDAIVAENRALERRLGDLGGASSHRLQ